MSRQDAADNTLRRMFINISVVLIFASLMASLIIRFNHTEPDLQAQMLKQYGKEFEDSAINAHWQWQAEGRPEMIMLIHYDSNGRERDRRPVRMAHFGWPWVETTSDGCEKLWQMLLNVPMRADGFRVIGEFYRGDLVNNEPLNAKCRYRLSSGLYFDYSIFRGNVTFDD